MMSPVFHHRLVSRRCKRWRVCKPSPPPSSPSLPPPPPLPTSTTIPPSHSVKVRMTTASYQPLQSSHAHEIDTQRDSRTPNRWKPDFLFTKLTTFSSAFFGSLAFGSIPVHENHWAKPVLFFSCGLRWPHLQNALCRVKSRSEVLLTWVGWKEWDLGGGEISIRFHSLE
jgi:hypothetical protein